MPRIYLAQSLNTKKLPRTYLNPRLTAPQGRYMAWLLDHGDGFAAMPDRSSSGREEQILNTLAAKKLIERRGAAWRLTGLGKQVARYGR